MNGWATDAQLHIPIAPVVETAGSILPAAVADRAAVSRFKPFSRLLGSLFTTPRPRNGWPALTAADRAAIVDKEKPRSGKNRG